MSARMDADSERELRELRVRAYGPRADIAADPTALRRLEELEAARAASVARRAVGSVDVAADSVAADSSAADSVTADESAGESASDDLLDRLGDDSLWDAPAASAGRPTESTVGRPAHLGRRRTALWVASVVASAAVAALVTFTVTSLQAVSMSSGAPQVDTLRLTPDGTVPQTWFGAEADVASAEFAGLTIFETPGWVSESGDRASENRCLSAAKTSDLPEEGQDDEDEYMGGPVYGTCGVASFPTALAIPFSDEMPEELIERYPSGIAIQFVLDGDRIGVFVDSGEE